MAQYRTDIKKLDSGQVVTRYEVMMLSDQLTPSGGLVDAFGRIRTTTGFTLFDSQHRYQDNGKWSTANNGTSNVVHSLAESAINLNVGTANNDYVYRETTKVFAYQPGKSLLIMSTFAMDDPQANLVQRVGYFGTDNGVYLENNGTTNYIVLRSNSSGTISETRVAQDDWNIDTFDGNTSISYSAQLAPDRGALNVANTNIFWTDVEWLGVGDVRCGFIVDGKPCAAHIFHNDNLRKTTYMTTACLPLRYEIKNVGITASSSTLKQICSTVISEGGYELYGKQYAVAVPLATPKNIATAGVFTPIISIRLRASRLDAIVIPKKITFVGTTNNTNYRFKVVVNPTLDANASWVSATSDGTSSVEYDVSSNGYTGGRDVSIGYSTVASGDKADVVGFEDGLFRFQLERNSFTGVPVVFSLVATGSSNSTAALGAIEWEEIFQ